MYFNIQALADKTGLTRRTIRYYVQRGLIPKPEGGGRGHYYTEEHLNRIKKIQQLSSRGLPLEAIKRLLSGKEEVAPVTVMADMAEAAPPPTNHRSRWTRVNLSPDIELSFRDGALSEEDQRAIERFIRSRAKG